MRIVAGKYKSHRLKTPKGRDVRPTSDRVKESLFAILRDELTDARVLDLFAGSGNLGIEALSREAASCVFVDESPMSVRSIRENLKAVRAPKTQTRLIRADALDAIRQLSNAGETFDLIFLDPPYATPLAHDAAQSIGVTSPLLARSGLLVAEHARDASMSDFYGVLTRVRVERYGDTTISFYAQTTPANK